MAGRKIAVRGWVAGPGLNPPDPGWTEVVALVAAYLIAVVTTPAGISGAVLLLPNPGPRTDHPQPVGDPDQPAVQRHRDTRRAVPLLAARQTGGRLALVLIAGTLPGVLAGSVIRVKLLPGPRVFDLVVGRRPDPAGDLAGAHHPAGSQREPDRPIQQPIPASSSGSAGSQPAATWWAGVPWAGFQRIFQDAVSR